jgi:hypothetical protein
MNTHEEERMKQALRQAVPPIANEPELTRDLWPAMLGRMNASSSVQSRLSAVPWFDWVLAGGLAALLVVFPASIPILLYYF